MMPRIRYSAFVFAAEAQRLMRQHVRAHASRPFFAYLPFQSVHGPEEVPDRFAELYNRSGSPHYIATQSRRTHQGMVTALDEAVGNLTATFKETGLYNNSLIWFSSDNGGPLGAANNFPLRCARIISTSVYLGICRQLVICCFLCVPEGASSSQPNCQPAVSACRQGRKIHQL
eukprot:COSAG01_NODE_3226_length_6384_cov_10.417979_11_plen_173_part_00